MKQRITVLQMVLVGLFSAVIAVITQISIPLPSGIPITLQTFIMPLCGFVLGWKLGTMSTLIYLGIGILGAPVFSNFTGGIHILFGKTGGFLIGFIVLVFLCGKAMKIKNRPLRMVLILIGLVINHIFGAVQFAVLMKISFIQSVVLVSLPYLIKDIACAAAAYFVGLALTKALASASIDMEVIKK